MEVFPPDDNQPNDVDSGPTIPHRDQIKNWDESFASLEIALQAACETKDTHSDISSSKEPILPNISLNENQVKTDVKRKWDDEVVDVGSSQRKLKRMNNMLLGSGELTIHLVGSTDDECDNIPIPNLITIVKSETKPKTDELDYDIDPEKVLSEQKHSLEFTKIEPKKEIKDENIDFKNETDEFKSEISSEIKRGEQFDSEKFSTGNEIYLSDNKTFSVDDKNYSADNKDFSTDVKDFSTDVKNFSIKDESFSAPDKNFVDDKNFSNGAEITVSKDVKSDSGFTDDLSTESKADFFSPDDDILPYDIKNSDELGDFKSDVDSECPLSLNMSCTHSGNGTGLSSCPETEDVEKSACDESNMNDAEDSSEKKKEKEKKDEAGEKSSKKDDKLLKKKKFERCNIRDIKLEDELDAVTLSAQKEEQERIRRLQEAQMRALQERLQQIEVEKEALTQLFSQSPDDAPNLFDSSMSESDTADNCKKSLVKKENDVVLLESSDEDKKAELQSIIPAPIEENIIDISSSSSGNESDSDDSDKKDDDVMVLSDEGETEGEGSAEDPNNSGAHTNDCFNLLDEEGRVLVNVGHPPEDPDIFLAPQIAKVIKPHQIGGIRFLYDNVVENLERYKSSSGFGCILAHSMGLGKTVQVVSFVDVFLRHTPATLVLCIVPINTIQNWKAEFDMWVPPTNCVDDAQVLSGEVRPRDYNVYTLNENFKTMAARAALIAEWRKQGGVLLMGYEMYRMLALRKMPKIPLKKSKRLKKQESVEPETNEQIKKYMDEMYEHIVIPGPDLVICDEGHRIKNSLASTSMALKSIKTRRRVVLTGYPLQNNLLEYWCMVDFVRPNYLGSRAEFCNMFERPISNGQCIDSTPRDRQLMRFRSHVLHSLLVGFVQRRGHSVLRAVLPKKEEHVLLIRMTPIQRQLYKCFVKDLLYVQQATNPLKLFAVCCKIWNHPDILYKLLQEKKAQEDIDLDIDITIATNSGISGTGGKKRAMNQAKSKLMQRSLRALPRNLKPQPGLINSSDNTLKSETVNNDIGNAPTTEEASFTPSVTCKEEFTSNQTNLPDQKDFSQQGSQSYPNQYPSKNLNQQLCQQNYPLNSGQYSSSQTQYMSTNNSLISSQIQYSSQTSPQSGTQQQYAQSPLLQQQYGQPPNQYPQSNTQSFSQVNSQFGIQANPQEETTAHPPPSPSQTSFQGKPSQSFTSQSNALPYSQRAEVQNQFPQNPSQTQFSKQANSNQDVHFPHSQPSNKKFNSQSSQQYPQSSVPHQPYNSQTSSQQYSQPQSYPQTSKQHQYAEQQPALQFSSQLTENLATAQQSYSQLPNPQSHASEQPPTHHFNSQSTFQRSPPHSQFSQAQSAQQFSQQSTSLPSQFSNQGSFSQIPEQFSRQPSPTQTSFSQSSTSQVYTQLFSQSTEFSQLSPSHQQFQQQSVPFPSQQTPKATFSQSHQSFPEATQNFTEQTPSVQTQFSQAFSQSYLQSDQQYAEQSSPQQFSQQNFSSQQTFGHQSPQVSKYPNKQVQQNAFSPQSSVSNLQFSQLSPQAVSQKQVSSSPTQESTQQKFNQQTFPSQPAESQYSQQSGSSLSYCQQSSQSNAQSFSQHGSQPATQFNSQQITPPSHQYIQMSNTSQFNQASSNQTYNQQASQQFPLSGNQSSQQYNQSQSPQQQYNQSQSPQQQYNQSQSPQQQYGQQINPSSQYSQQSGSNSQQFPQQSTSTQQFSPPTKAKQFSQLSQNQLFSQQTKASHFPQTSQNQTSYSQQVSQAPQPCSQQLVQNTLNQQTQFSQQQSQMSKQYSLQVPSSPQQYTQPSQSPQQFPRSQSPQQFLQQPDQSPQPYAQHSTSSSLQSSQSSQHFVGTHSHQFSQQTQSQEFGQPSSSESFNKQAGQVSQQYNQRNIQTPEQFNSLSGQSKQFNQGNQPQQFTPQSNQTSQVYKHQGNSNSQAYKQQIQSPPQYNQISTQSQQQYSQKQLQSSQQYSQQSNQQYSQQQCSSVAQFPQPPCQSPQQFTTTVQSQSAAPSPQQFSQQPAHSPQYSQKAIQSPQQFTQPSQSPQQFPQQTSQSPQQFSQTTSPQQFVQQPAQSPQQYPQTNPSPQQFSQQPSPQQFSQQSFSQQNAPSPQEFTQQSPQQISQTAQQFSQLSTSQYKQQSLNSGQSSQFPLPPQCLTNVKPQQFPSSFHQSANQDNLQETFQSEYQNQVQSNIAVIPQQGLSTQSINQQASKLAARVAKTKQGRGKSLCQGLLSQGSVQHSQASLKQPPSFSVQSFQNGDPSSPKRPVGQQAVNQLPNSTNTSFQPLNSSIVQDNFSLQHMKQDSGAFPSKCSKAVLQGKSQILGSDSTIIQQLPHNPLKLDSAQLESDQPNLCTDTTLMPFRDRIDSSISYEWAIPIMKEYVLGVLENSHKMMVLFVIIAETLRMGDKLLVFSQSLSTLDLLEHFLGKIQVPKKPDQPDPLPNETWSRNKNYFRLDGSTSAQEREKLINEFNRNDSVSLFLLSTRAGCLGINLVGANRIVVMDASWNPCHDAQAVCRIYRYGQKKQCHIYRLVTDNSLEKRIYDRQVNKQGMSDRVVDELNPESNFTWKDVTTLIQDDEDDGPIQELSKFSSSYSDRVLKYLVLEMSPSLSKEPFEHESLLLDRKDLKLTKQEKRLAKQSYEMAKRANMINIRTTYTYLPAGTPGGGQIIINNKQCQWVGGTTIKVLPNQTATSGGNARPGTTATPITASPSLMSSLFKQGVMVQKLTMPSNVSIPVLTPGAPPVVIPAGQDVLVLRTPKGVYLRLPDGRIIAVQLPPSLLAKTQFRPNVVTHFRPAAPKGGNQPTTVINTPRGQSIGIIKQTLQCGGTVRYLGPRSAAGSTTNSARCSAPEVIDLSDDDEPSLRKCGTASNASTNSSESDTGSIDQDKLENMHPIKFPGKQITIRKVSPASPQNSSMSCSKDKCEIPQVLSKNKQITIMPINPSTQQNRQKFAPQLAQPVRVQQMLLQPQQGKRKPFQKNTSKVPMSSVLAGKNIRPQITITQPALAHSSIQSHTLRQALPHHQQKGGEFLENMCDSSINSPTKQTEESSSTSSDRSISANSLQTQNVSQILQNSKNISISLSDPLKTSTLPDSLVSLTNKLNPNLQISPVEQFPNSQTALSSVGLKTPVSDIPQKNVFHPNTSIPAVSSASSLQTQIAHNTVQSSRPVCKSPQLSNKTDLTVQQLNVTQSMYSLKPTSQTNYPLPQTTSLSSSASALTQDQPFPHSMASHSNIHQMQQKRPVEQQSIQYSSQIHSQNPRLTASSVHQSQPASRSQQAAPRKRKSSNKLPSKKSQHEHSVMTQGHSITSQATDKKTSQQFRHSQLTDHHLSDTHFTNFVHPLSGSDFQAFSNFSPHKPISHIQHPQPLHPLQHSQEHTLPPHLQHMSHIYPMSTHIPSGSSSLSDMQPPAPRAWPVPQPAVSSFHPFSQSSSFYSSGQESTQFSFQPSSFPLPPSSVACNTNQSESNINSGSGEDKTPQISSSDL